MMNEREGRSISDIADFEALYDGRRANLLQERLQSGQGDVDEM